MIKPGFSNPAYRIHGARRMAFAAASLSAIAALSFLMDAIIVFTGKQPLIRTSDPLALTLSGATGLSLTAARALSHLEGLVTAGALFVVFLMMYRLIAGVPRGEAFVKINAYRLAAMSWVFAALFGFHLLVNACLPGIHVGPSPLWIELLAVAILRGLAEMFREGASMRDELEGTV